MASTSITTDSIIIALTLTSTSTVETNNYPKGFKFLLPKPFKGDQNDVESWLFNIEEYFHNTNLSVNKWIWVAVSNMNGNVTLWWWMRKHWQDEPQDWPNFKIEIWCQFLPKNITRAAWHQLEEIRQVMSVMKYNVDFAAAMIEVADLSEA